MLPIVRLFKDLHIVANIKQAKASLKGLSGIYCFRHIASGKIYLGQAVNLSARIMEHIKGRDSNIILQRAIEKYGLEAFEFIVVEFVVDTSLLTTREQVHLDWLFSVSSELRYNICPTAESRLGTTHTAESKAAISAAGLGNTNRLGTTHTAETRAKISAAGLGNTNGRNHPHRKSVFVYDHETRKLVGEYSSLRLAAKVLKIHRATLLRYLANGKVWNNKYIIRSSPLL